VLTDSDGSVDGSFVSVLKPTNVSATAMESSDREVTAVPETDRQVCDLTAFSTKIRLYRAAKI